MAFTFKRAYPPQQPPEGSALWFPFHQDKLLVAVDKQHIRLIEGDKGIFGDNLPEQTLFLGTLDSRPCIAFVWPGEQPIPEGWREISLRELYGRIADGEYAIAGYALQILNWQRNSRFCPACSAHTVGIEKTWGRQCSECSYNSYPPVTPAVLVLVHDGERILMAHKPGWGKRYGLIAGFVEPGETLEECVQREVQEEASLEVTDVEYMDNQAWPFPHQLMVGFAARYTGGTPIPEEEELDDVRWFTRDTLPELPPPFSLAYVMIARWLKLHETGVTD